MKTIQFPDLEEIENQAANWVAKIDRGISADEEALLEAWLAKSSLHGASLVKTASMWDLLDVLKPIAKLMPIDVDANSEKPQPTFRRVKSMSIAATIMLCVGLAAYVGMPALKPASDVADRGGVSDSPVKSSNLSIRSYKTAIGEISTVSLPDGSSLELNTDSEVLVRFTDAQRNIELRQGEVYFDVVTNSARPFVVSVGADKVTAIGTAFSIDAGDVIDDRRSVSEVIVTEGKVQVTSGNRQLPLYLVPGQKAVAKDDAFEVSSEQDPESLLAWREGMVVFQGESLTDVIAEVNRYTPLKFSLLDQELASISVGGFFKTGDLDQLLMVLESNFGVSSEVVGNEVRLSTAM